MKVDGTLSWDDAASDAQRYERQGLDGAISTEGAREGFFPLLLAGRATERIELMTGVAIAFARNPMIIAQQANDLLVAGQREEVLAPGRGVGDGVGRIHQGETWQSIPGERRFAFGLHSWAK